MFNKPVRKHFPMVHWSIDNQRFTTLSRIFYLSVAAKGGVHSNLYQTFLVDQRLGFFLATRVHKLTEPKYISFKVSSYPVGFLFLARKHFVRYFDNIVRSVATRYRTYNLPLGCQSMVFLMQNRGKMYDCDVFDQICVVINTRRNNRKASRPIKELVF